MTSFRAALSMCWNTSVFPYFLQLLRLNQRLQLLYLIRGSFYSSLRVFLFAFIVPDLPMFQGHCRLIVVLCNLRLFKSCIITLQPPKACTIARACPIKPGANHTYLFLSLMLFSPLLRLNDKNIVLDTRYVSRLNKRNFVAGMQSKKLIVTNKMTRSKIIIVGGGLGGLAGAGTRTKKFDVTVLEQADQFEKWVQEYNLALTYLKCSKL